MKFPSELTLQERFQWLQLIRSGNVGSRLFYLLLEKYGSAQEALAALPSLHTKNGKTAYSKAHPDDIEREMAFAHKHNISFIAVGESDYPPLLRHLDAPPPLLAIQGNRAIFKKKSVSIVGSRNASAVGMRIASIFANGLGEAGFSITSGFARGIDAVAHKASLKHGTIAIMAGGLNHMYPPEHKNLYKEILAHDGACISEMPLGWTPRAQDFPQRNRLIAGIAMGLLVVEASIRSGSLISARYAAEFGRLVFAIPACPLDLHSMGTNKLIKNGAHLVEMVEDIIELLAPLTQEIQVSNSHNPRIYRPPLSNSQKQKSWTTLPLFTETSSRSDSQKTNIEEDCQRLLENLSVIPIDLETLSLSTKIPLSRLYLALIELELTDQIIRHSRNMVSLPTA